jgi:endonuclease/exonuclease/phosphatase family metal-dependent hydrolase
MLWLNYISIVSLIIGIAAKYIPPVLFWIPAFFGLAFPFIFLLNILFLLYWFIQFRYAFLFGFIALCFALPTAYRYIQFSSNDFSSGAKLLSVTSYNCMLFDLYNWKKNHLTRPKILNSVSEINPDIICFQEFYTSEEKGDYNNVDTIKKLLGLNYYHAEFTYTLRDFDHWGIATFSKYPIINQGKIIFNTTSNNICIYSDIVRNNDTIRIYNLHLQSIRFSDKDNKFLEDMMAKEKDVDNELQKGKNILRRLKRAFTMRSRQVEMIAAHMKTCRYKIILCGDFNDTAASYAYETLRDNLKDCFIEKGHGIGRTYAGKWPQFRIDYILHDKKIKCKRYERSSETFTDHYPITAWFEL